MKEYTSSTTRDSMQICSESNYIFVFLLILFYRDRFKRRVDEIFFNKTMGIVREGRLFYYIHIKVYKQSLKTKIYGYHLY